MHDVAKINAVYRETVIYNLVQYTLFSVNLFKIIPVYLAGLMTKTTSGPHRPNGGRRVAHPVLNGLFITLVIADLSDIPGRIIDLVFAVNKMCFRSLF